MPPAMRRLLLLILFLMIAVPASATTYYISITGSNGNDGLTKATAWKSHPYMQNAVGCGGAPHSYVHAAGDRFIFKGGDIWPAACFILQPLAGGSSSAVDYYGVDLTWFTGGSFTKPVFDMQNSFPTNASGFCGGSVFCPTPSSAIGWITIDNIEIKNLLVNTSSGQTNGNCNTAAINFTNLATGHFTVQNTYLHGWKFSVTPTASSVSYQTGSVCQTGSNNTLVDNVESTDVDGKVVTTGPLAGLILRFGGGIKNINEVKNSSVHDTMAGCFTVPSCHDSQFFRITSDIQAYDTSIHTQVIEDDRSFASPGGDLVYNNLVHDNTPVGVTIYVPYNSYIYNNVLWNNSNKQIMLQATSGDSAARVGYVLNNTVDCSNGTACVGMDSKIAALGTLNLKNNHWITDGTPTCFNTPACVNIATIIPSNNLPMGTVTANTQGYTIANKYKSNGSTVNYGTNLKSISTGNLTALGQDTEGAPWYNGAYVTRPTNTGSGTCGGQASTTPCWDAGAYEFVGGVTPPAIPTGLTGSVTGSTVNASWTASSGSPVPTAYTFYRGSVHGGPYSVIKSGLTSTSTTDTPPNGTWFYVVTAYVGGIVSSISGSGSTATVTCTTGCSFPSGTVFILGGNSVSGFNGTFTSTGQPTSSTFTFASSTVGTGTNGGVWRSGAESAKSNEISLTVPATLSATLIPASRVFANTNVGSSSPTQTFTFTNTSGAGGTITISGISYAGGNSGDFSQTNNCPSLLMSGLSCTITGTFSPTAAGLRSSNLAVADNAPGNPHSSAVSGTGVTLTPGVSLNPTSLNFGDQTLSTTSTARSIILTNTGSGTLTISSVVASGDFAVTTVPVTNCGGTLASLATCSLNVTFTPTATGGRTGAVTVTDNASGSPHVASLSGNGITTKCQITGNVTLSGVGTVCQ